MAKQLNVNLAFTANTAQARQQLQQLQTQLNSITSSNAQSTLPLTKELQEAQIAAANLQVALQSAVNVDTGQLDLTKFSVSLKKIGTDLPQIKSKLTAMGPEGQKAFQQLAQSIVTAEVPLRRANESLIKLGTTLKNTVRWQISSSLLTGFISSVSTAFNYAKDLNESLNNIRIK